MAEGGLVQLMNYGNQDIMLTGTPEITFFRIIFRRYTNFGMTIKEIPFNNEVDFGNNLEATIPKSYGDLLTKLTLKIKLPTIDLTQLNNVILTALQNNIPTLQQYLIYYNTLLKFINKLKNIVDVYFSTNDETTTTTYIEDLKNFILTYLNASEYQEFFISVNFFFNNKIITTTNFVNVETYTNASLFKNVKNILVYIYETATDDYYSFNLFKQAIYSNMSILTLLNTTCYDIFTNILTLNNSITGAWIEDIAIYIINELELSFGSNIIQKMSSDYINNYGELHYKNTALYEQLIGNGESTRVSELIKPSEYLYLPLPFYFCENYGLSLPLIAIHYSTIHLKMKLAQLSECIYFTVNSNSNGSVIDQIKQEIANLVYTQQVQIFSTPLEMTLLAELVFLDGPERKKFAQSGHEYLITQVQEITFEDVNTYNNSFDLQFFHCVKEVFWFLKQYKNTNNLVNENNPSKYDVTINSTSLTTEQQTYITYVNVLYNPFVQFNLNDFIYGLAIATKYQDLPVSVNLFIPTSISPALTSNMLINGFPLAQQASDFFNYLQPYVYYNSTPELGLNSYSYCLHPTETQPSGSINLTRIPKFSLTMTIYNDVSPLNKTLNISKHNLNDYQLVVQAVNFNVLRFIGGYVGVAYSY